MTTNETPIGLDELEALAIEASQLRSFKWSGVLKLIQEIKRLRILAQSARDERDALQARIEELEAQPAAPVAFYDPTDERRQEAFVFASDYPEGCDLQNTPLYTHPPRAAVPEEWVLLPRIATPHMEDQFEMCFRARFYQEAYDNFIRAAPKAPGDAS